ncbi:MAG: XRE family transcriptional regulator [Dehalococcoidia bacterium]|nr:MAG: XRE family transcriptional regulator [Dehalococcoidia bacterium]
MPSGRRRPGPRTQGGASAAAVSSRYACIPRGGTYIRTDGRGGSLYAGAERGPHMDQRQTTRSVRFRRALGRVVRDRRRELCLSQGDLASAVDVTQGSISNYENGRTEVPLSVLLVMCEQLRIQPMDVIAMLTPFGTSVGGPRPLIPSDTPSEATRRAQVA